MDINGLNLNDQEWTHLNGGYRVPFDPRPILRALENGTIHSSDWEELATNLYHQGDVGEASYAAVPHLVRTYADRRTAAVDTYSIVVMVELARSDGHNPPLPDRFSAAYSMALAKLAAIGLQELPQVNDPALISYIIAVVALEKGQPRLGQFAALFDEEERGAFLRSAGWI